MAFILELGTAKTFNSLLELLDTRFFACGFCCVYWYLCEFVLMAFSSSVCLFLVGFLLYAGKGFAEMPFSDDEVPLEMEKEEFLGILEVMGALLEDSDWALEHPQPCTETPWPGVECEIGDEDPPMFHVTKIHIGPDILTPPCKSAASLSESLLKLPYLQTLSIFSCFTTSQVTLSPKLFGALSSLEHLTLVSNPTLSGEIPSSLSQISSLRILSLSQNNLQGKVPSKIGSLVSLEQLDLSYNNLSGQIPEEIGGLESLTILDLSRNVLEGQAPSSIGQLKLLQKIDFSSNRLRGPLPNFLSSLKNLTALSLDNNSLTGTVPPNLETLPSLDLLNLSNNQLIGELTLPEDFIERLGKRLVLRGNNGLCTSNSLHNKENISGYVIAPLCLNPRGLGDQNPTESVRMKPLDQNPVQENSSAGVQPFSLRFSF
ncbi:hypothetical protein ACLB2K_033020 [Fragaria x ananassa]